MKASTVSELIQKLGWRKRGYQQAFAPGAPGHDALIDLAKFCRAFGGEVVMNNHDATLILAGRREAYFRIIDHMNFDAHELMELYKATKRPGDEG